MAKFYTPYGEKRPEKPSNPGKREEQQYIQKWDENGHPYLEENGIINTYDIIQSHKEETELTSILARAAAGDPTAMRTPGAYLDLTKMPNSYSEAFNMIKQQRVKFDELPVEIKKKFGNSFEQWASTAGTDEWSAKMGFVSEEVNTDEPKQ